MFSGEKSHAPAWGFFCFRVLRPVSGLQWQPSSHSEWSTTTLERNQVPYLHIKQIQYQFVGDPSV
jgi:hypothetical protein